MPFALAFLIFLAILFIALGTALLWLVWRHVRAENKRFGEDE